MEVSTAVPTSNKRSKRSPKPTLPLPPPPPSVASTGCHDTGSCGACAAEAPLLAAAPLARLDMLWKQFTRSSTRSVASASGKLDLSNARCRTTSMCDLYRFRSLDSLARKTLSKHCSHLSALPQRDQTNYCKQRMVVPHNSPSAKATTPHRTYCQRSMGEGGLLGWLPLLPLSFCM